MTMNEEMKSLQKNQTWDLVELPKSIRVMGRKWIFKKKFGSSSEEFFCYKACLVAEGYNHKEGVDYNGIFSPVVRHTSICVLLALVEILDMELEQLDVKTVFLHGRLDEGIVIEKHEGFEMEGKENFIYKLKRSLYGLKQSPRQWYKRFDEFIVSHGYIRSSYDSCVYHSKAEDGCHIYLLLYVDDIFIEFHNLLDM